MRTDCTDICEIITGDLFRLGLKLNMASDDHDDVIEALGQCKLVHTVSDALDFIRNQAVDRADYALAVWHIDDVLGLAKEHGKKLTKKQAREVISLVDRKQDATIGISWDTIDCWIDMVKEGY